MKKHVKELGEELLKFIERGKGSVSFVNVEDFFKQHGVDYKGELALCSTRDPNIIYWVNWNELALSIYQSIEDKIKKVPCSEFIYLIDGKSLKFPTVKSPIKYKTEHWLPVVLEAK